MIFNYHDCLQVLLVFSLPQSGKYIGLVRVATCRKAVAEESQRQS